MNHRIPEDRGPTLPSPRRASVVTRAANRLLRLVDGHPVIKVVTIAWVCAVSLWMPIDAYRRESAEARRGGWATVPDVELSTSDAACSLINADSRSLVEATLHWNLYWVDTTACRVGVALFGSHIKPSAASHELVPRGLLTAAFTSEQHNCRQFLTGRAFCESGNKCSLIVECAARYHRSADREPFALSRFAVPTSSCDQLRGLATFATTKNDEIFWKDQAIERTWSCFSAFRRQYLPQQRWLIQRMRTTEDRLQNAY